MEVKVFKPKTPNEEVKYLGKLLTETDIDKNMTHGYNILTRLVVIFETLAAERRLSNEKTNLAGEQEPGEGK